MCDCMPVSASWHGSIEGLAPAMFTLPVLAFAVALCGAVPGIALGRAPRQMRIVAPFSGGLLLGIALFGLLPELADEMGWMRGLPVYAAGYGLLLLVDRYLHAVCPSCAHSHHHEDCAASLHGFAGPLACAAAAHAFLDGWGLASVRAVPGAAEAVRLGFPVAVMLHKLPEGLALGAIFRASTKTRRGAMAWCALAESATLVGGWAGVALTPKLGSAWTNYPLALAGGCFLYLGYHAVHGEWRRGGVGAMVAGAAGVAAAAVVQRGVGMMLG